MKRHSFTLVEMLVVIAVIAILAGIAFPVVSGMNRKGKETRARSEINAIITAIKQYEADYGTLPYIPGTSDDVTKDFFITSMDNHDNYHKQYDEIMEILMNLRPDGHEFDSSHKRLGNLKNKRYLDPPTKKVTPIDGTSSTLKSGYYLNAGEKEKIYEWGQFDRKTVERWLSHLHASTERARNSFNLCEIRRNRYAALLCAPNPERRNLNINIVTERLRRWNNKLTSIKRAPKNIRIAELLNIECAYIDRLFARVRRLHKRTGTDH